MKPPRISDLFDISGRVGIITGGAGLLGTKHAEIVACAGGIPVLIDIEAAKPAVRAAELSQRYGVEAVGIACDITDPSAVRIMGESVLSRFGRVDILINNAANNPKIESGDEAGFSRVESFPLELWDMDLRVGLLGAFLCCRTFGPVMAKQGKGVIINVASDLAVIAPDQRLYEREGVPASEQPVKPVTYSVVKAGLVGLTRYLATYWNDAGVRVNAISPGGVANGQPDDFVQRLRRLIPLGRMADVDEYQGAILFLCSDASSYMTGSNLIIDGGRSCW